MTGLKPENTSCTQVKERWWRAHTHTRTHTRFCCGGPLDVQAQRRTLSWRTRQWTRRLPGFLWYWYLFSSCTTTHIHESCSWNWISFRWLLVTHDVNWNKFSRTIFSGGNSRSGTAPPPPPSPPPPKSETNDKHVHKNAGLIYTGHAGFKVGNSSHTHAMLRLHVPLCPLGCTQSLLFSFDVYMNWRGKKSASAQWKDRRVSNQGTHFRKSKVWVTASWFTHFVGTTRTRTHTESALPSILDILQHWIYLMASQSHQIIKRSKYQI